MSVPESEPAPAPAAVDLVEACASTRERVLDAAERLFAERGFRATSVRRITERAECNVAAVNYHFGGKELLYREVFHRRLTALRERRIDAIQSAMERAGEGANLDLLLRVFTSGFVEPLLRESTGRLWVRLMAWELVDRQLPREMFEAEMMAPVQQALTAALARVCPGLGAADAELCVHSLVGQLVHIVHLHRRLGADGDEAEESPPLQELVRHTVRFSAAGIRALAKAAA